ncbi:GTP-binding protein Rheb isoform X1 [Rattus norvegicus]|uniref:GTP-binding protein Rheb isoform X1 n=1 Tax=Rattus norvegicus TaxID=10116 RepID=UPI002FD87540
MPQSKSRKIAILGYRSVGKSSLTIQFVEGQFVDSYDPTIENTFTKLITVNGQEYHLQLVDTAGQDEYSIFPQTYSIDINGYILVYSVTSIKSFEVIKVIHGKLLDMVGKVQIPIMLVGNKKDLHMERVISYEEGKALAESWNAAFLESSAKENQAKEPSVCLNPFCAFPMRKFLSLKVFTQVSHFLGSLMHPAELNGPVFPLKHSLISEVGSLDLYALLLIQLRCPSPLFESAQLGNRQ